MTERDTQAWNRPCLIRTESIGEAWLAVAAEIAVRGRPSRYDGMPITEIASVTLDVSEPSPDDSIIASLADPDRLNWMRENFASTELVEALGDARSYASRFRDYAGTGRDQIGWVIDRLKADPSSRSAAITTFEPLLDSSYIPCVSLLDFWVPDEHLDLVVYAHSIDFGAKGYGNLVQLAELQREVAAGLGKECGQLQMVVKSAHIYGTDETWMRSVLQRAVGVRDETPA